jgi:hypothetical protein
MALEYNQTKDPAIITKLREYTINQWLMGNGVICGTSMAINVLGTYLGVDQDYIRLIMRDKLLNSRIWDKDKQEELLRAMLGETLSWALEDRMEIAQQVEILKASQGGKYVPFISAELNKALKLKLETQGGLQWTLKSIMGNSTTNIFNTFNQQNNVQEETHNYISLEEARSLIIEANSEKQLSKSDEAKYLDTHYDIPSLPSVVADQQDGQLGDKEGLNYANSKRELEAATDNYKLAMEESSREHHELRREIENNINPEDEDPELDIYEEDYEEEEKPSTSFASSFLLPH